MKYTWNFDRDDEYWNNGTYDTIAECIEAARKGMIVDENYVVYIGETVPYEPGVDAVDILERLEEEAHYECGDVVDGWDLVGVGADKADELSNAFTQMLKEWLKKYHLEPYFYAVRDIREYSLITGKAR